ncbi:SurA N-terminal domain-containing protein [Streptomyces sp. NPDC046821]|uniref:SurA N-terminal domain-containing protein n=1 Tax=Streptomyces sp. NPDC046821 TaxID=3154702 RepID=UPI0033F054E0
MHRRNSRRNSRRTSRRTALALSSAALVAVPLLTACGNEAPHPGAAAVVGSERITVSQLQVRVNEVRAAQRAATGNGRQYEQAIAKSGGLTRSTLNSMVFDRVLHQAATDAGIGITRKQIQDHEAEMARQAGGAKQLRLALLQQYNVAPQRVDEMSRTDLEVLALGKQVGADMQSQNPADQAPFWKALDQASKKLNVDLNPRYGTWDIAKARGRADAKTPWVREVTAAGAEGKQPM